MVAQASFIRARRARLSRLAMAAAMAASSIWSMNRIRRRMSSAVAFTVATLVF